VVDEDIVPLNVVLASARSPMLEELLRTCGAVVTVRGTDDLQALAVPSARQPDVVVVEHDETLPVPGALLAIRRQHPATGIIMVLSRLEPGLLVDAMRGGVSECLEEPVSEEELRSALQRLAHKPTPRGGEIFAVVGAKGGVGATTVAVNLATMLTKFRPPSTLLLDLHLTYGDAGVFLGAEPRFSIADALDNLHRLDATFLRALVTQTKSGVTLIPSSDRPSTAPADPVQLRQLIEIAAAEFPYMVLDVPRSDFAVLDALDQVGTIIVVANQELATVRSAGRMATSLEQRYGKERIGVVITRYDEGAEIGQREVERAVGRPVSYVFPNNYAVAVASLNKGRPLVLDNHSKLAGAFTGFARALANMPAERPPKEKSGGLFSRIGPFRR
jgi:pilus assembly protein CpaE